METVRETEEIEDESEEWLYNYYGKERTRGRKTEECSSLAQDALFNQKNQSHSPTL